MRWDRFAAFEIAMIVVTLLLLAAAGGAR